jgi:GH35 family endo-1,4-beta-xylanase
MEYTREMFENLPEDANPETIRITAEGLARHNYDPLMILSTPGFLQWKKADVLHEYDRLVNLETDAPELVAVVGEPAESLVEKQLGMLLYHYNLLCRLRAGEAAAWDVVNELYEDD